MGLDVSLGVDPTFVFVVMPPLSVSGRSGCWGIQLSNERVARGSGGGGDTRAAYGTPSIAANMLIHTSLRNEGR